MALFERTYNSFASNNQGFRACSLDWIGRQPPKKVNFSSKELFSCDEKRLNKFMDFLEIKGVKSRWRKEIRGILHCFLKELKWKITEDKTLKYLLKLRNNYSRNFYRKKGLQIRRFLLFHNQEWAQKLSFPSQIHPVPRRVAKEDLIQTLEYFKEFKEEIYLQCTTAVYLLSSSGMRATELYRIRESDIDLDNKVVFIKSSKTGTGRIAFFNKEAENSLREYIAFFKKGCTLLQLFSEKTLERRFKDAPLKVKDLRKFFSQEWDRRGGPTSIKKILMGHSLKNDIDLMHYNYQSEEDLKRIYDKVGIFIL